MKVLVAQSCPTLCDPMHCISLGSSVHGDSLGKNTGVGSDSLLQGIFPTQGLKLGLISPFFKKTKVNLIFHFRIFISARYKSVRIDSRPSNAFFGSWPLSIAVCSPAFNFFMDRIGLRMPYPQVVVKKINQIRSCIWEPWKVKKEGLWKVIETNVSFIHIYLVIV